MSSHDNVRTEEIGVAEAVIHRITTTVDGGILITLTISAQDISLATALMNIKTQENPLVTVAFVRTQSSHPKNELLDKVNS